MSDAGYWVHISRDGTRLGAGFLLVGCYVLTAYHCVEGSAGAEDAQEVEVEFESGEVLPGRVHRSSAEADLTLIDVPKSGMWPVIPRADRALGGEAWQNPYRPSLTHALLTGTIDVASVPYQCEGGDTIEAIQLGCAQDLGDYGGYSGSPIEGGRPEGESKLFGVLIEQYPEHHPDNYGARAASVVLFAATLSEVFRRFDCFDLSHLIDLLPSSSGSAPPAPNEDGGNLRAGGPARNDVLSGIAAADAKIEALDEWRKSGLLDEQAITALKVRVIEYHLLSDRVGEQS